MTVVVNADNVPDIGSDTGRNLAVAAVERLLAERDLAAAEVGLSWVDDATIHELNRRYRGQDRPTDVLSFPVDDPDDTGTAAEPLLLGDVVVSLERAWEQAQEYGHSFERELSFLAVHGTLHLLGYDHGTDDEEAAMMEATEAVLRFLNLGRDSLG